MRNEMIYLFDGEAAEPAPVETTETIETPAPTTEPAPAKDKPWYADLPDEVRTATDIAKYQAGTLEDFARAHLNLAKLRGVPADKMIEVPDPSDKEATRAALQRFGLPRSIEDPSYALTETKGEDGQPFGPEFASTGPLAQAFRQGCFEEGVLPGQMQNVFHKCNSVLKQLHDEGLAQVAKRQEDNLAVLRHEYGDLFDEKAAAADFAAEKLGIIDILNEAGIGSEPAVQAALIKVAPLLAEQSVLGDLPANAGGRLTREGAAGKARALQAEAINLPIGDPRRKRLNEEAAELWKHAV